MHEGERGTAHLGRVATEALDQTAAELRFTRAQVPAQGHDGTRVQNGRETLARVLRFQGTMRNDGIHRGRKVLQAPSLPLLRSTHRSVSDRPGEKQGATP